MNARGRHSKNSAPKERRVVFAGSTKLSASKEALRKEWEKMTINERGIWNYNFGAYKDARLDAASS